MSNLRTMSFGKYEGVCIKDLPTTYIAFCIQSFNLPGFFKLELIQELDARLGVSESLKLNERQLIEDLNIICNRTYLNVKELQEAIKLLLNPVI
jgi:uncharacterized protein (DUF3820 family)